MDVSLKVVQEPNIADFSNLLRFVANAALACNLEKKEDNAVGRQETGCFFEGNETSSTTKTRKRKNQDQNISPSKRRRIQRDSSKLAKLINDAKCKITEAKKYYNL